LSPKGKGGREREQEREREREKGLAAMKQRGGRKIGEDNATASLLRCLNSSHKETERERRERERDERELIL